MVTAEICRHEYNIDSKNVGTCRHCGQIVKFSFDGRQPPVLITPGDPEKANHPTIKPESKPQPITETTPEIKAGPGHPVGNIAKGKYYDSHRKEIEADIEKLGLKVALKKWNIQWTTWVGLGRRWNHPLQSKKREKKQTIDSQRDDLKAENEKLKQYVIDRDNEICKLETVIKESHSYTNDLAKTNEELVNEIGTLQSQIKVDPEKVYITEQSPLGQNLISELIEYWRVQEKVNPSGSQSTIIKQTIIALESIGSEIGDFNATNNSNPAL